MPLISVIIPAFNAAPTLETTLRSVMNQNFVDIEILVIDDGSDDETVAIAQRLAKEDSRIYVFSYPNGGVSASRNRGICHAQGEYLSFIDADDLWTSNKLAAQYEALQIHKKAAVAYSWTDNIDAEGNLVQEGIRTQAAGYILPELLQINLLQNGSNPLIRRFAFETVGGFDESLLNADDWDMWLRLAQHYEFVLVAEPQVLYRRSETSKSAKVLRMEQHARRVIDKAFAQAPKQLQSLKVKSLANLYKYLAYKALQGVPSALDRQRVLSALRFLFTSYYYQPVLLKKWKPLVKMTLRSLVCLSFPPNHAEKIIAHFIPSHMPF
ncbi:glycosyltransferase [Synechococcus sp. Nb3U1]|uniref:glycosyltransferase family 2 protein n=1 Tax=Synechococcus sp. Nb3U1 TaxID=1914529 RepID=UPI001F36F20C|nr:glycosyltransferase [Synechococcus sp. Nb3U1]MCF2970777.1 glycosyltransferase [Synechococcus sp. Nb3U1]